MKPKLNRVMQQIARAGDALRFADAGEFLPFEDKTAVLGIAPARVQPRRAAHTVTPQSRRKVALVVETRLGKKSLGYALNVCERMDADLEVLIGPRGPRASIVQQHIAAARGERRLAFRLRRLGPDILVEVARYAWTTGSLLFVVTAAGEGLAERFMDRGDGRIGIPREVPWVVVTDELAV